MAAAALGPLATFASGQGPYPGIDPPGANDFSCEPPARHPRPIVLVHGTGGDMTYSWNRLSPLLVEQRYCVFALDYGNRGLGKIQDSARELRAFVNRVLEATGARRVSIVGHSQGGMMPRYYVKFLRGARRVGDLVGLVPSNHGTTNPLTLWAGDAGCVACDQQIAGSRFIRRLNAGDETPGSSSYTQVTTRWDEIVTPYRSAYLRPDDDQVTNVTVQDRCPLDLFGHSAFVYDPVALQWVLDALFRRGPADPRLRPDCTGRSLG